MLLNITMIKTINRQITYSLIHFVRHHLHPDNLIL